MQLQPAVPTGDTSDVPVLSQALQQAIAAAIPAVHRALPAVDATGREVMVGHSVPPPPPLPNLVRDAARVLPQFERVCLPASENLIVGWLRDLARRLPVGAGMVDAEGALSAALIALAGLPAVCFTAATQQTVLRAEEWFPSGKRLYDHLRPLAAQLEAQRDGLRSLSRYAAPSRQSSSAIPSPSAPSLTDEERAAIADQMRQVVEEMRAKVAVREIPRVTPRFLTPDQLAEARRQAGIVVAPAKAAVTRLPSQNIDAKPENLTAEAAQTISGDLLPSGGERTGALAASIADSWT